MFFFVLLNSVAHCGLASHVSWVAEPFDDCVDSGSDCKGEIQLRKVECKDVFTGDAADGCQGQKPAEWRACSCALVGCSSTPFQEACPSDPDDPSTEDDDDYEEVGCFKREADDEAGTSNCDENTAEDKSCMTYSGSGLCRSGF